MPSVTFKKRDAWCFVHAHTSSRAAPCAELIASDLLAAFRGDAERIAVAYGIPVVPEGPVARIVAFTDTPSDLAHYSTSRQVDGAEFITDPVARCAASAVLTAFIDVLDAHRAWSVIGLAGQLVVGARLLPLYRRVGFSITRYGTMIRRPGPMRDEIRHLKDLGWFLPDVRDLSPTEP